MKHFLVKYNVETLNYSFGIGLIILNVNRLLNQFLAPETEFNVHKIEKGNEEVKLTSDVQNRPPY